MTRVKITFTVPTLHEGETVETYLSSLGKELVQAWDITDLQVEVARPRLVASLPEEVAR